MLGKAWKEDARTKGGMVRATQEEELMSKKQGTTRDRREEGPTVLNAVDVE